MSDRSPHPAPMWPPLDECARRLFELPRLFRAGAVDAKSADNRIDTYRRHPNARIGKLAEQVARQIGRPVATPPAAPMIEVYAR